MYNYYHESLSRRQSPLRTSMAPFPLAVILVALALWTLSKESGCLPPGPNPVIYQQVRH